jgi:hypothetical protein
MQASYHSTDFTSAHIHESEVEGFEWLPEELRPHLQYMLGSPPNKRGREREREREKDEVLLNKTPRHNRKVKSY